MQPIEINVKVTIGMENALLGVISKLMNREAAPEAVPAPKPRKQARQVEQEPQSKPEVENPQAEAAAPQTEQPAAEPAPAEPAAPAEQPAQNKEYTEVDVRAAMHKVRQRIEGENYKTNTTGERYLKYHKPMADTFIQLAMQYGASKPSAIDDPEKIKAFEAECEQIHLDKDGNIATGPAPF